MTIKEAILESLNSKIVIAFGTPFANPLAIAGSVLKISRVPPADTGGFFPVRRAHDATNH
jgi:hypothetical protein